MATIEYTYRKMRDFGDDEPEKTEAQEFKVGDRVKVLKCFASVNLAGEEGTVKVINGPRDIGVEFDRPFIEGHNLGGPSKEGHGRWGHAEEIIKIGYNKKTKSFMKTLTNYYKKLTDADTQALVEAGYLNGDLEPTFKAEQAIKEINFFALKASLVERAKEEIAEAKKEEKAG